MASNQSTCFNKGLILIGFLLILSHRGSCQTFSVDSLNSVLNNVKNYFLFRNHDSTFIRSYADRFAIKLIAVNKINYFNVRDRESGTSIRYRPEYGVNLGLGISYKWFALDLAFNVGLREDDFKQKKHIDFQGRIFSSKQFIEGSLQYYYGYKLGNISGIDPDYGDIPEIRHDIRTVTVGLQYLYAFNYDKFSLKAPFVLNEIQRKSAGSVIFGVSFAFFTMDSDSSIVPNALRSYYNPDLHLTDLANISLAANLGYMYTYAWKENIFLTFGLIPGLSLNLGDFSAEERHQYKWSVSYKIKTMNSIGYNSRSFFAGVQFVGDWNNIRLDKYMHSLFNQGSLKLFAGYRFREKRNKIKP